VNDGANPGADSRPDAPRGLVSVALALNAALVVVGFAVYFQSRSQLVLAQAADSLLDIAAGVILVWSVRVGSRPRDADHPFGHQRAEPIGALVTAVLAGVLCFEILRSAGSSLVRGAQADLDLSVACVLAAKLVLKLALLFALESAARRHGGAALAATRVDTRIDVVASASSLAGYGLFHMGWSWADAGLALPVALYVGANGLHLARENLRYLMGEAPEADVTGELKTLARGVAGVLQVGTLRAHYVGHDLHVDVSVVVDPARSATENHDIEEAVVAALRAHPLVGEVFAHVDTQ
jgi:cation diffusion facilitator family transporter